MQISGAMTFDDLETPYEARVPVIGFQNALRTAVDEKTRIFFDRYIRKNFNMQPLCVAPSHGEDKIAAIGTKTAENTHAIVQTSASRKTNTTTVMQLNPDGAVEQAFIHTKSILDDGRTVHGVSCFDEEDLRWYPREQERFQGLYSKSQKAALDI